MMRKRSALLDSQKIVKKRRIWRIIKICFYFLLFGLFIYGLSLLSYREEFAIQNIIVEGSHTLTNPEVVEVTEKVLQGKYLYLFSRSNIVIYPQDEIRDAIKSKSFRIADVDITRILWNSIVIKITEREPVGVYCGSEVSSEAKCYLLDKKGFIFDYAPDFSGTTYIKFFGPISLPNTLGSNLSSEDKFVRVQSLVESLPAIDISPIWAMFKDNYYEVKIKPQAELRLNYTDTHERVISVLASLLNQVDFKAKGINSAEYIDLRYDGKIFYKNLQ